MERIGYPNAPGYEPQVGDKVSVNSDGRSFISRPGPFVVYGVLPSISMSGRRTWMLSIDPGTTLGWFIFRFDLVKKAADKSEAKRKGKPFYINKGG